MGPSTSQGTVSGQLVEGLFHHALERRMTPTLRRKLAEAGLDVDGKAPESVNREDFARWLQLTVESLFPGVSEAEAYRQLGRDVVRGYSMTLFGSAVIAVSRVIGPRRTLERIARNASSMVSSYRTRLDAYDDFALRVWINEDALPPTFLAGLLAEAATLSGAPHASAQALQHEDAGWMYDVRWGGRAEAVV